MSQLSEVRLGIIGVGGMGTTHLHMLTKKPIAGLRVTAVCDNTPRHLDAALAYAKEAGAAIEGYDDPEQLMKGGQVDAILIATPHYLHPPLSVMGLEHGLHVMSEKPAGVYTKQVRQANAKATELTKDSDLVFGIMFNQRTRKTHQAFRDLVASGEMGKLLRTQYVLTTWYRSQIYYDSATWKGTWEGEGGAVLLNQSPHNLDLFQWICGMPRRVRAFAKMGHHHRIETEDEVTCYCEYEDGGTGTFVTSTGEAPGFEFLHVVGNNGTAVMEDGKLSYKRLTTPIDEFTRTTHEGFARPKHWDCQIPSGPGGEHREILENWTSAILNGTDLIAPGTDGLNGVMLANAMLLSAWTDAWVDLPFDEAADERYWQLLQEKIKSSTFEKKTVDAGVTAVSSF